MNLIKRANDSWKQNKPVKMSIVTAIYNRIDLFKRTIESVLRQTESLFEYIIIDDGSSDDVLSLVNKYMYNTEIPILYIKKENGGPHTARNLGIKEARGEYLLILDADDELVDDAVEVYLKAWNSIPTDRRNEYREVVARNMDEYGKLLSLPYPNGINDLPKERAMILAKSGAHISANRTEVLKENPFDEPEGVTFVDENLLWLKLDRIYRAYYINKVTYIYHMDIEDSICHGTIRKKTIQHCINSLYNSRRYIEINEKLNYDYLKRVLMYTTFLHVLKMKNAMPTYNWNKYKIKGIHNRLLIGIVWLPTLIVARNYIKKRM